MKEDIEIPRVKNVTVAIIRKTDEIGIESWYAYLLNQNSEELSNVIVASTGYGEKDGEKQRTSTLRHFFEKVEGNAFVLIEPIQDEVFHLTNEYWVSYFLHDQMYDKKFLFLPESIQEKYMNYIPLLDSEGILHS